MTLSNEQLNELQKALDDFGKKGSWTDIWTRRESSATLYPMLTPSATKVVAQAETEARNLGHGYIGATHLVLALAKNGHLKADYARLRKNITRLHGSGSSGNPAYTARFRKITELAANQAGTADVNPQHLILGLVDHGSSDGAKVLAESTPLAEVKDTALQQLGRHPVSTPPAVTTAPQLARIEEKLNVLHRHFGLR
jgi:ATP-dependent Clp protease ATP-binding subunit ClpA